MRFKINLHRLHGYNLPINYQYELSSAIYRIIDRGDAAFARFLHDNGYHSEGKSFRLFTFSHLSFDDFRVFAPERRIQHKGSLASFTISFLIDRAAEEFIKGLFLHQHVTLGDALSRIDYEVASIEGLGTPHFTSTMHYRCLSPILVKQKRPDGGENYLSPDDDTYCDILMHNLSSKAHALLVNGSTERVQMAQDVGIAQLEVLGKVYKKGVTIKQHTPQQTHLIGYMYEFALTCPPELHEIGYYAGFGHLGSQGFGCVEVKGGGV